MRTHWSAGRGKAVHRFPSPPAHGSNKIKKGAASACGPLRLAAALLCCLCVLPAGCAPAPAQPGGGETSGQAEAAHTTSVAYCATDSLDPYKALSKSNRLLCSLLYDPLVKLDNAFEPVNVLAAAVSLDGRTCAVTLKEARFSDGSAVSAQDVVYSFQAAKKSQTSYAASFADVRSSADGQQVVFTLPKHDPLFVNLLDFPIFKAGSDKLTDSDNRPLPPVGCGRYALNADRTALTVNAAYHGKVPAISEISLVDTPDDVSLEHYLDAGVLSFYYDDLYEYRIPSMPGTAAEVNLNSLLFVGVNMAHPLLADVRLRYALACAVDRAALCEAVYFGYAAPAAGPLPAAFAGAEAMQTLPDTKNTEIAVAHLEDIGYNNKDAEGYLVNAGGHRLKLSLLYNASHPAREAAAVLLQKQLAQIGVEISLAAAAADVYTQKLQTNAFDLYLGERTLPNNMDIAGLAVPGQDRAYGVSTGSAGPDAPAQTANMYAAYGRGECELRDVLAAFATEMPCIPLCHRRGLLLCSASLLILPDASAGDPLFGVEYCVYP